jgi:hypothetical protein
MPVPSIEQLKQKEAALKGRLAAQAPQDPAKRRALAKKLRRTQRKRRKAVTVVARQAGKAGGATAAETPAE